MCHAFPPQSRALYHFNSNSVTSELAKYLLEALLFPPTRQSGLLSLARLASCIFGLRLHSGTRFPFFLFTLLLVSPYSWVFLPVPDMRRRVAHGKAPWFTFRSFFFLPFLDFCFFFFKPPAKNLLTQDLCFFIASLSV